MSTRFFQVMMMLSTLVVGATALMGILMATPVYAQSPDHEFTISIGQTLTFDARGVNKVTVGLSSIASVNKTTDERQLLVTGVAPGTTTVTLYTRDERKTLLIRVVSLDPVTLAEEVKQTLGTRSGVQVRIVKGRVLLEGQVAGEVFKRKIEELVKLYPNQVLNFTTHREAFVEGARMVALEVHFVQLASTGHDKLGVAWGQFLGANYSFGAGANSAYYRPEEDPGFGPGIMPGEQNPMRLPRLASALTGGQYWSLIGNVTAAIDFMAAYGMIKEIKHSTIVTEGGTQADYQSGGTLLIKVAGNNEGQLIEKPYGLKMELLPVLDVENRVKVDFKLDISELDYSNSIGNIPALRNSLVKGTVNMEEGQSVLIATQQSILDTENKTGLAYLAEIPIVGLLFSSRNQRNSELNNAIFITPRVYDPKSDYHNTLINGAFDRLQDAGLSRAELPKLSNAIPKLPPTTTTPPVISPNHTPSPAAQTEEPPDPRTTSRDTSDLF